MATRTRVAWFCFALGSLAACVTPAVTVIPHPSTHAAIAPNLIPAFDSDRAIYYGVSNAAFAEEASLVTLDARSICFTLTLRVDGEHPALARLESWRVYLRADPVMRGGDPQFGVSATPTMTQIQGSIQSQPLMGTYGSCGRFGMMNCSSSSRYAVPREAALVTILTSAGSVCFAHDGQIDAHTRQITLHLDAPDDMNRRLAFRWRLDP